MARRWRPANRYLMTDPEGRAGPRRRGGERIQRNVHGWPMRAIRERSVRIRRGRGIYVLESLECGHSIHFDKCSGAMRRAKQRGCWDCYEKERTPK